MEYNHSEIFHSKLGALHNVSRLWEQVRLPNDKLVDFGLRHLFYGSDVE